LEPQEPRDATRAHSSVVDAFRATLDLFEMGVDVIRQNLRRRHRDACEAEIDRLLDG
jgi:hypothetical protein